MSTNMNTPSVLDQIAEAMIINFGSSIEQEPQAEAFAEKVRAALAQGGGE